MNKEGYLNMDLLRFTTAGSVDDGKSTLIGRLLYDSKSIFEDQLEAVETASKKKGEEHVNLALLTDGLRAEREQGITIDVAYRYFATPKRKFIIADTPGHIQYTRNMVTGASSANLAIILVDARKGILEQTIRHSFIASLLQIPHIIYCINKMDLVEYSETVFEKIKKELEAFSAKLDVKDITFIPISALKGDNVVERSTTMNWYQGPTLMYLLENIHISGDHNLIDARFPVQYVIRPQSTEYHDFRGYAGRMASGVLKKGEEIMVLPSGFTSRIKSIYSSGTELEEAFAPMSVTITLEDEIDISRGDMVVRVNNQPEQTQEIDVMLCWFNEKPLVLNGKYALKHTTKEVRCIVKDILYKMDINTLSRNTENKSIGMNDIARVNLRTTAPLLADKYHRNRITGSLVLIDEATNETVAAGMII
ncbi:MAG: sulfate adenylyltransferase subunit CysN [Bacteroidetes bacterium]|nr:sulfate adenylyltransferase subunit CysN [Bacteroidota bacterium]MBV6460342.1 Bifunctional enzyme CysN/CysC [Flavobacteriales bacterium]NOG95015.1 sulfate adenylyltransferase subunit CysN [Bacteroidota bacterium]GIK68776.1 MAG: sulfate adenylyltransferase subunit 1 [Bacteroidota bacterium]CAG0999425.1 bifunctional enzyme CysN/CysC [Flavobacteriales bacterium]